jgi:hypothetical protein
MEKITNYKIPESLGSTQHLSCYVIKISHEDLNVAVVEIFSQKLKMRGVDLVAVGRRFDSLLLRISADGIDESRMSPGVGVGSGQFKGFICVCVCVRLRLRVFFGLQISIGRSKSTR